MWRRRREAKFRGIGRVTSCLINEQLEVIQSPPKGARVLLLRRKIDNEQGPTGSTRARELR